MKRVLLYENRKSDPMIWDISTEELRQRAFLELFKVLDEDWGCYAACPPETPAQIRWYERALKEDEIAASHLLYARKNYEYEDWQIVEVR